MAGAEVVGRKTESNRLDSGSITYLAIKGRNRCAEFFEFAVRISATLPRQKKSITTSNQESKEYTAERRENEKKMRERERAEC